MRGVSLSLCCLLATGCFPDWDLLDPGKGTSTGTGGAGVGGSEGGGGTGGTAGGTGGTSSGVGGSEGGGGMEPLGPWSTPQIVPELSHAADDDDPSMTADGLELYFNSHRNGGSTGADIWVTTRATRDDDWGPPTLVVELSSAESEGNHTVSPDGLTMWFKSDRLDPGNAGAVFISTRPDRDSAWSTPVLEADLEAQNIGDVGGVTSDGLTLLGNLTIMGVQSELVLLVRADTAQAWGAAVPVRELNSDAAEDEAWLHPDGTVVYFGSNRTGSVGSKDLWSSTRATPSDPWGTPVHEMDLASDVDDTDPTLTPDLRYVLFSRPVGAMGEREILEASR